MCFFEDKNSDCWYSVVEVLINSPNYHRKPQKHCTAVATWALHHVMSMFDKQLEASKDSAMVGAFGSQPLVMGSRSASVAMDMHS